MGQCAGEKQRSPHLLIKKPIDALLPMLVSCSWPDLPIYSLHSPSLQDIMRVMKERLVELMPELRVFLDVDDLKQGKGGEYVDQVGGDSSRWHLALRLALTSSISRLLHH